MADANAGDVRVTLRLLKDNFDAGMKAVNSSLDQMGKNTQRSVKYTTTSLREVGQAVVQYAGYLGVAVGASVAMHKAWKMFTEYAAQETGTNRVIVAMEQIGLQTDGVRERIDKLGREFILLGQKEESAWRGFNILIRATHDTQIATNLLTTSLRFAHATEKEVLPVVEAVAKAYGGKTRNLAMMTAALNGGKEAGTNFAAMLKLIQENGKGADRILGESEIKTNRLKAAWDDFSDTLGGKEAPAVHPILGFMEKFVNYLKLGTQYAHQFGGAWRAAVEAFDPYGLGIAARIWGSKSLAKGKFDTSIFFPRKPEPDDGDGGGGGGGTTAAEEKGLDFFFRNPPTPEEENDRVLMKMWLDQLAADEQALLDIEEQRAELLKQQAETMEDMTAEAVDMMAGLIDGTTRWQDALAGALRLFIQIVQTAGGFRAFFGGLGLGGGGSAPSGGGEFGDFPTGGGGGVGAASLRPLPIGGVGPAPVYITVQGDVTRFGEFSAKVITDGSSFLRRAGR